MSNRRPIWVTFAVCSVIAMGLVGSRVMAAAAAGSVSGVIKVTLKGAAKPSATGVVVYLVGFTEPAPATKAEMQMEAKGFMPQVVPVTAGQTIDFPNRDSVYHNVFSASATKPFDLGQYPQGESKSRLFGSPGVIDVYCNIHPLMAATILVLPNRKWTVVGKDGKFSIDAVPVGKWTLYAYSRFADKPIKREVTIEAGANLQLDLAIDEVRTESPHLNKFGQPYSKDGGYK
ncbi:MAG: hypothetical protein EXR77_02695 [Myxococcales bacterium]|nr:hypothetical protein [Myxococcales bacterium]